MSSHFSELRHIRCVGLAM